ncbi:MAG TPA: hypothetical protein VGG88_11365, partial [Gaiellaceae bacterium]
MGLNVRDYGASRAFYAGLLASVGWTVVADWPDDGVAGFGPEGGRGQFWLHVREPYTTGAHVAFTCDDRPTVDAFHAAG